MNRPAVPAYRTYVGGGSDRDMPGHRLALRIDDLDRAAAGRIDQKCKSSRIFLSRWPAIVRSAARSLDFQRENGIGRAIEWAKAQA